MSGVWEIEKNMSKRKRITNQIERILPPSTARLMPRTALLLGRHSQVAAAAVSSGSMSRWMGTPLIHSLRTSSTGLPVL